MKWLYNLNEIDAVAAAVWQACNTHKVWAFEGEMGAGKTTLVAALCKYLQVADKVGSPTYSLINEYRTPTAETLYHMDLYRLRDEEEAMEAGVEECLYSGNYCFVEWAEKAAGLLPADMLWIVIKTDEKGLRELTTEIR